MSTVKVGVGNIEIDAAQALLDLCNVRNSTTSSYGENKDNFKETAQLFLNCLISNVQPSLQKPQIPPKVGTVAPMFAVTKNNLNITEDFQTPIPRNHSPYNEKPRAQTTVSYNQDTCNKRSKLFKRKPMKHFPNNSCSPETVSISPAVHNKHNKDNNYLRTCDIGTQTDDDYQLPIIQTMEFTIARLCEKIKSLEQQLRFDSSRDVVQESDSEQDFEDGDDESYKAGSDMSFSDSDASYTDYDTPYKAGKIKKEMVHSQNQSVKSMVLVNRNLNVNGDDMVPLGDGHALIPAKIFRHINWNSYTSATRKLLTAVFSRRILATHSLTGKPSPAFPNKPAKKKLDPALVNDIVQTVKDRCGVPENVVRTSITTKCADESKMYRTREENKKQRKVNRENIPPGSDSDNF